MHRFYQPLQQGDYDTLTGMFHPDFAFYPQFDSPGPAPQGSSTRRRSTSTPSPASA
jgi:ketosteroid isomerase-like protein